MQYYWAKIRPYFFGQRRSHFYIAESKLKLYQWNNSVVVSCLLKGREIIRCYIDGSVIYYVYLTIYGHRVSLPTNSTHVVLP